MNKLYYGDNLEILWNREYFPDKCVDLIYRDHDVKIALITSFGLVPEKGGNPRGSKGARVSHDSTKAETRPLPTGRVSALDPKTSSFGLVPGTQVPSPASVPKNAELRCEDSSGGIPSSVTPEQPALQAGAPAFPAERA